MDKSITIYGEPIYWDFTPQPVSRELPYGYTQGSLTFNSEGNDNPNSLYFSRMPHWPEGASGVTIGRGYDMKYRTQEEVFRDLMSAGVSYEQSAVLSAGAGLTDFEAKNFVSTIRQTFTPISEEAQKNLFDQIYPTYIALAESKANSADVVAKYGYTDWENLHPAIKEVIVDMTYQGQYRASTRALLQPSIVANDLYGFISQMQSSAWPYSKDNRYEERLSFLESCL